MHPKVAEALEEIDAAMFTGLPSPEDLQVIEDYIARWQRQILSIRETHFVVEGEDD